MFSFCAAKGFSPEAGPSHPLRYGLVLHAAVMGSHAVEGLSSVVVVTEIK